MARDEWKTFTPPRSHPGLSTPKTEDESFPSSSLTPEVSGLPSCGALRVAGLATTIPSRGKDGNGSGSPGDRRTLKLRSHPMSARTDHPCIVKSRSSGTRPAHHSAVASDLAQGFGFGKAKTQRPVRPHVFATNWRVDLFAPFVMSCPDSPWTVTFCDRTGAGQISRRPGLFSRRFGQSPIPHRTLCPPRPTARSLPLDDAC